MNPTLILGTVLSLAVGGALGSAITYQVTSRVQVTCPAVNPAPDRSGIPPSFFKSEPHPTTGGQQY